MIFFKKPKKIVRQSGGYSVVLITLLFTIVTVTVVLGMASPIIKQFNIAKDLQSSKASYFTAEAGGEDVYYRIRNNLTTSFPETLSLDDSTVSTSVSEIGSNEKEILSTANTDEVFRTVLKDITVTDGFAFNFALQTGIGGLRLHDSAKVLGNVYANGTIIGKDITKNIIFGDVVSAGSSGLIDKVYATSSAYARTISNSKVDKDAYYVTLTDTTVGGVSYPDSVDRPEVPMPIADSLLDQWEADAVAGGTTSCSGTYLIGDDTILGPQKFNCNVEIDNNNTDIILKGAVWVNGNLTIKNSPKFKVDDSLGNKSVPVIAHLSSAPTTSGKINIENSPTFFGSESNGVPNPDSYVMLVSRNTSAESGGTNIAISAGSNTSGNLLLYAPHGEIALYNNVILREVTGYRLSLFNNTEVIYSIGLAQPLFTSGPGGQWKIKRWKESYLH